MGGAFLEGAGGHAGTAAEPRRRLAMVLRALPGPWGEAEVRQVHRLLRDPCAEVWGAACDALASRAGREGPARRELLGLLASGSEEIRLRGLTALGGLGDGEALPFLEDRREEAAVLGDVALMDRVAAATAVLSREAFLDLLEDPRELVRASAAAHLPPDCEVQAVEGLARDPSVQVRVALAGSAASGLPDSVLWLLAADPDAVVRQALAEELPRESPSSLPLLEILQRDADPLVQAAARPDRSAPRPVLPAVEAPGGLSSLRELEVRLDSSPGRALEILRPVLESDGAEEILEGLSQVARDPDLAGLCRALAVLRPLAGLPRPAGRERLLEALGSLPSRPALEPAERFRSLLAECLRAAEADLPEAMRGWAEERGEGSVSGSAGSILQRLADIASGLDEVTCTTLSHVSVSLEEVRIDLERECPDPERALLRLAVEIWSETVEERIAEMLTGATK